MFYLTMHSTHFIYGYRASDGYYKVILLMILLEHIDLLIIGYWML